MNPKGTRIAWGVRTCPRGGCPDRRGQRTNGVALLAAHGFDAGIQRKAERVAAWLAGQRLIEDGAGVLTEGAAAVPG